MKRKSRALFILAFLSPAVLVYAGFVLLPLVQSFQLSLYRWRGVSQTRKFVGLENYHKLAQDDVFYRALKNNLWLLVICPGANG